MKFVLAYFSAWTFLFKLASPLLLLGAVFLGFSSFMVHYLLFLVSTGAFGGPIRTFMKNNA